MAGDGTKVAWEGGSPAVAQISTFTVVDTWATGDIGTLTCGAQSVSYTLEATQTPTAMAEGLVAAWNASTAGEVAEVTATSAAAVITLTADTAGVPFTVTSSETTAGDGTIGDQVDSTANSGPNDYGTAANWSTGLVPANDEDVVFENSSVSCLYGLAVSGVTVDTVTQKQSFTGHLGLPRNNANGYVEYRPMSLETGATDSISLGQGEGTGSGRIKIKAPNLTAAFAVNIYNSGTRAETGIPCILLTTGTQSNDTTMTVNKGDVGVAFFAGETAVIDVLDIGYMDRPLSDATVVCGDSGTGTDVSPLTTINKTGGKLSVASNAVTITQTDGEISVGNAATVTTLNVDGGTAFYNSIGICTTGVVGGGAILDFRQDGRDHEFTNCSIYETGAIYDPGKTVTWTNGIDLQRCRPIDVTLDIGTHQTLTPSAI